VVEGEIGFELVVGGIVDLDEFVVGGDWVAYAADGVGYSLVAGPLRFVEDGVEVAVVVVEVGAYSAGVVGPLEALVGAGWWCCADYRGHCLCGGCLCRGSMCSRYRSLIPIVSLNVDYRWIDTRAPSSQTLLLGNV
jgi:hypothetical protein